MLDRIADFAALIATDAGDPAFGALRAAETRGRPMGTADFVAGLERVLGRPITRRALGRKPAAKVEGQLTRLYGYQGTLYIISVVSSIGVPTFSASEACPLPRAR